MAHLPYSTENDSRGIFNVSTVSQRHPVMIARLLFCVAICIQQLPPDFDQGKLETKSANRQRLNSIMEFLIQNVTSDDEIAATIEGVECLTLQGIYEVNAGNLRRSWLAYRKAVTMAQFLGLHRVSVRAPQERQGVFAIWSHYLWFQVARVVSC